MCAYRAHGVRGVQYVDFVSCRRREPTAPPPGSARSARWSATWTSPAPPCAQRLRPGACAARSPPATGLCCPARPGRRRSGTARTGWAAPWSRAEEGCLEGWGVSGEGGAGVGGLAVGRQQERWACVPVLCRGRRGRVTPAKALAHRPGPSHRQRLPSPTGTWEGGAQDLRPVHELMRRDEGA